MSAAESASREIVPSVSIAAMVNQREAVRERITEAVRLLKEAELIARQANLGFPAIGVDGNGRNSGVSLTGDYSRADEAVKAMLLAVDRKAWEFLLDQSGIRSFMSADVRKRWTEQLYTGDMPPLDEATIRGTFGTLYAERGKMLEDGVIAVFKGQSWDYKTNAPQKFGKRLVMNLHGGWSPCHYGTDKLDDLLRVLHAADNKPEPDHRRGGYQLVNGAMKELKGQWPKDAENEYIAVRLFKNGNGHVTFKRPELVDSLNRIIARRFPNALPAPK